MINPFLTQRTKSKFVFAGPSKSPDTLFKLVNIEHCQLCFGLGKFDLFFSLLGYELTMFILCVQLNRYISPEQVPIQYGGLSVDFCDCNPDFSMSDPVTEIPLKPNTKQTVEIAIYEV